MSSSVGRSYDKDSDADIHRKCWIAPTSCIEVWIHWNDECSKDCSKATHEKCIGASSPTDSRLLFLTNIGLIHQGHALELIYHLNLILTRDCWCEHSVTDCHRSSKKNNYKQTTSEHRMLLEEILEQMTPPCVCPFIIISWQVLVVILLIRQHA